MIHGLNKSDRNFKPIIRHMVTPQTNKTSLIGTYLTGQYLIAMPSMADTRFHQSVIYLCTHDEERTMGIVINKPNTHVSLNDVLEQFPVDCPEDIGQTVVYSGGPIEVSRGLILHTDDYFNDRTSLSVADGVALTASIDILRAIADHAGPREFLFSLGYAGWGQRQLEAEIAENVWLTTEGDPDLMFKVPPERRWETAIHSLGIEVGLLSSEFGHA